MLAKLYEMAIRLAGHVSSSLPRAFRSTSNHMRDLNQQTNTARTALRNLERVQNDVARSRQLQEQVAQTSQEFQEARTRVNRLAAELMRTENPTRELQQRFRQAESEANRLNTRLTAQRSDLQRLQAALREAGADTRNLDREYADLTWQLQRAEQAQRSFNRAVRANERNQEIREKSQGALTTAATAAAPLVGLVTASSQYANAQKQIRIQSNLTAQQATTAWNVVRKAHLSGLGEGIQQTAVAYGQMSQIIKNESANQQKTILQGALAMQQTWSEAPDAVAKAVQNMTSNFKGLSKIKAMDMLTAGFKNGMNYAGDYLDTLYEYSPQFESIGYNAEQFYSILAAGKNAGAFNLDKVADAVKEFNIRAKDGSKTTSEGFSMIGLDADKMASAIAAGGDQGVAAFNKTIKALNNIKDPVKRNQAGVALFGTRWEDLTEKVILNMNVMDKAGASIDGATKKMVDSATAADGGTVSWVQLGRNIYDAAATMGKSMLPAATQLSKKIISLTEKVSAFTQKYPALTSALTLGAAGVTGFGLAVAGLTFVVSSAISPFLRFYAWFKKIELGSKLAAAGTKAWAIAQRGLSLVMGMNPYAKAAMLIMGLVTAGVYLYKNWDKVKQKASELWETISNAFKSGVNKAIGWINSLIEKINLIPGINIKTIDKLPTSSGQANVANLHKYATGGFADKPSIFGEAGPEVAIPLRKTKRSIELWEKTGKLLGVIPTQEKKVSVLSQIFNQVANQNQYTTTKSFNFSDLLKESSSNKSTGDTTININAPFNYSGPRGKELQDQHKEYIANLEGTIKRVVRELEHNNRRVAFV